MIAFGKEICQDFNRALQKEWLETNGIGGYASSTICGAHSRRYHGLLAAAVNPTLERRVLLSKIEESLLYKDSTYLLSCNQYPGAIFPEGYRHLEAFKLDPFPIFKYVLGDLDDLIIKKSVFMIYGKNATAIVYEIIEASTEVNLELRPLLACRGHHHLTRENIYFNAYTESPTLGAIKLRPYDEASTIWLSSNIPYLQRSGYWYKNFQYHQEALRGLEYEEDLYSPGYFQAIGQKGDVFWIVASTQFEADLSPSRFDPTSAKLRERNRREAIVTKSESKTENVDEFMRHLILAADSFIVNREFGSDSSDSSGSSGRYSIIAGYHWFEAWGRDAMISLPGLILATKRYDVAKSILKTFLSHLDMGMIPNRFPESGQQPDYNTVDATLWMFYAIQKYLQYTGDIEFLKVDVFDKLKEVIDWHVKGTRYNIHLDSDGLIYAGEMGCQLTWMDAKVGDRVITPRLGKAVEINALWYNALKFMEEQSGNLGQKDIASRYADLANKAKRSFNEKFWHEEKKCLYDCINGDYRDGSVRPNQVIAVSLPYGMLSADREKLVVEAVEAELLTPMGLRTLSPRDDRYIGQYIGDVASRDSAYHQGTVWPWLMGPFIDAYLKVNKDSESSKRRVKELIQPFVDHLQGAGIGSISEIFDGDFPHLPKGCISQAWSVAEIARVYLEVR